MLYSDLQISKIVCIFAVEKISYRMKNISQKLNLRWMSGSNLSDNHHCISLHSIGRCLSYPLFLLLIALAVCCCKSENEPSESTPISSESPFNPAAGADSLMSVLEGVSSWRVMAIVQREGVYSFDLYTEGTTLCFANSEVTFAVPYYTSINFSDNSESTTEYEQHGPYSVNYKSANTLTIADELFEVSAMANGGYALTSKDLSILIKTSE